MSLELPKALADEILSHAQEEAPNECCGILAGRGRRVERVYRTANVERSPYTFRIDEQEHCRAEQDIDRRGLELLGYYHSHLMSPPRPSATDAARMFYRDPKTGEARAIHPDVAYLIVSLQHPGSPTLEAYRVRNGGFAEEELVET